MIKMITVIGLIILISTSPILCQEGINRNLANVVAEYILEKANGQIHSEELDSLSGDLKIHIELGAKYPFSSIKTIVEEAFEGMENSEIVEDWTHYDSLSRLLYIYGDLGDGYFVSVDFVENPVMVDDDGEMMPSNTSFITVIVVSLEDLYKRSIQEES